MIAYWLSNFIADFIKYIIPAMVSFFLVIIFNESSFVKEDHLLMLFFLLIFFGISMIWTIYTLSFLFNNPTKAQVSVFIISYLFGIFFIILCNAFRMFDGIRYWSVLLIEPVLRIVPFFSFSFALLTLPNLKIYQRSFDWDEIPKAFSSKACLKELISLIIMSFVMIGLTFLIEFSYKLRFYLKKRKFNQKKKELEKTHPEDYQKIEDEIHKATEETIEEDDCISYIEEPDTDQDVLYEKEQVKDAHIDWSVRVKNLVKIYEVPGENIETKKIKAVKGISFGLTKGSVFGLLGTNGAGKTTTFRILTGDLYATSGSVKIKSFYMPHHLMKARNLIGYCPQNDPLIKNLTVKEHLEFYAYIKGIQSKYHKVLIEDLI